MLESPKMSKPSFDSDSALRRSALSDLALVRRWVALAQSGRRAVAAMKVKAALMLKKNMLGWYFDY